MDGLERIAIYIVIDSVALLNGGGQSCFVLDTVATFCAVPLTQCSRPKGRQECRVGLCGGGLQRGDTFCLASLRRYRIRMVALPVLSLGLVVGINY